MTALRNLSRRFRAGLSRFLWKWTRFMRHAPPAIAEIDPLIKAARAAHKPVRPLIEAQRRIRIEQMRRMVER